ncbi:MAG: mannitol dehydrogenase family protein [Paracoccaceae bacterium]
MKLTEATLPLLPAGVARPAYDRARLTSGIVHIGCGNFHRAHQAVYFDDLFALGEGLDFAITGAGVRDGDERMRQALAGQDWLYSVVELEPGARNARVIGSLNGFVPVSPGNSPLIAAMAAPATRIVSLTVTEGGYYIDPMTGTFSPDHPDIRRDAQVPDRPETAFGAIIAALKQRRAAGVQPFTVMCCDNVPHNGRVTRDAVVGLCALSDPALADWIGANVAFPNSMVDRITPATGDRERAMVRSLGLEDAAPVTCEPFRQWVMEDSFPAGRPPLERVGVTFTDRVDLYETMKIRILNGGHAIIAYPAGLLGIELVHEAMADGQIRAFLDRLLTTEVLPILPEVPGVSLTDYKALIISRFSNPEVADTVRRLCLDGSNRQPKFIVPSARDGLGAGRDIAGLALASALWCRYCFGVDETGAAIAPNDPNWDRLTRTAAAARHDPAAWLAMTDIYGDLGRDSRFAAAFGRALGDLWSKGTRACLAAYLAG